MKHYETTEYLNYKTIQNTIAKDNAHLLDIYFTNGLGGTFHKVYTSQNIDELKNALSGWLEFANEKVNKWGKPCKRYHTFNATYFYKSGKKYTINF